MQANTLNTLIRGGETLLRLVSELRASRQTSREVTLSDFADLHQAAYWIRALKSNLGNIDRLKQEYLALRRKLELEKTRIADRELKAAYQEVIELIQVHLKLIDTVKKTLASDSPEQKGVMGSTGAHFWTAGPGAYLTDAAKVIRSLGRVFRIAKERFFYDTGPASLLTWWVEVAHSDMWQRAQRGVTK